MILDFLVGFVATVVVFGSLPFMGYLTGPLWTDEEGKVVDGELGLFSGSIKREVRFPDYIVTGLLAWMILIILTMLVTVMTIFGNYLQAQLF